MFNGLCAFSLTPMADESVDRDAVSGIVSRLAVAGVDSIGVLGSTGLYPYLNRTERRETLAAATRAADGLPLIAGVGALRTRDVLVFAEDAQNAGASALLVAPVSYQRLGDEEVFRLYSDVASGASVPIVLYDNPSTTGFTFSDELYRRVAELPAVKAVKIPPAPSGRVGERIGRLRDILPDDVSVGISGDWAAAEALLTGCDAWYSVIGGLFPSAAMAIVSAARGKDDVATRLSTSLEPLWALFRKHGSLRVAAAAAEALGFVKGPCLPRPLLGLDRASRVELEGALRAAGLTG